MNQQAQIARIQRNQAEVREFVAEQHALTAKDARTVWMFPIGGMIAGASLFGAGAAFVKLIGT